MSDFPRGWTLSQFGALGAAASITAAAIAGVVHVLDAFTVTVANASAAFTAPELILNSSDGVFANFPLALVGAIASDSGTASGSGLDLAAGPGASLTISTTPAVPNTQVLLLIQGHDI